MSEFEQAPSYNQPLGGNDMPRFAGPGTMMRLPTAETTDGLDACFIGVPMDVGASHRAGTRFGPRQVRAESNMIRPYNMYSKISPFDHMQIADVGDVATNAFDLKDSVKRIEATFDELLKNPVIP
ncbi:MAG: arginase family protein, partial [Alphaproteobacteria bacterium]